MNLALFDLDDTLIPLDSDHAWGEFVVRQGWVDADEFKRLNDEFFETYKAGKLDVHAYIEFSTRPLRERPLHESEAAHERFMAEVIAPHLHESARRLVHEHIEQGDLVALVTATNEFVTAPIARAFGIDDLIAVKLERGPGGTITGRIDGVPSYREGKVTRVEQWLEARGKRWSDFGRTSVYSDSINDLPLLEKATHPVATNPSPPLEAVARERGWRILNLFK